MTYNCFMGMNQALQHTSGDRAHLQSSYIVSSEIDDPLESVDSDERRRREEEKQKLKESNKEQMASLILRIAYHLEKLRFVLEKSIYPRDLMLRLFDSPDLPESNSTGL